MNKMKIIKILLVSSFFVSIFAFIQPVVVEAGLGISPSLIENETIKKGTRLEKEMVLSRSNPDELMTAIIEPDLGEMNSWVTFEPSAKITLPKDVNRVSFKVIINVPEDAALKDYDGVFRVYAEPEGQVKGVSIVEGVAARISLTTTTVNVVELSIRAVQIPDTYEKEDLLLELTTNNKGNTNAAPSRVEVEVQTLLEEKVKLLETTDIESAPPYGISTIKAIFKDHGLVKGEYFGLVKVYKDSDIFYQDRVVFVVNPEKVYEEVCTGVPLSISENTEIVFFVLSGIGLLVIVVLLVKANGKKVEKDAKKKKMLIIIGSFILFEAIIFPTVYLNSFGLLDGSCEMVVVEQEDEIAVAQEQPTVETSPQVEGLATESQDSDGISSLNVVPATEDGKYKVYKEDDLSSAVIYLADQGEEFNVIEERSQWYRIQLEDGTDGWLPKQNVQDSNVEER